VDVDLAGTQDGISERFVPEQDSGRLIEVEHVARYRWAAQAVAGRRVLDAGCGTAYGTRLLAEGGASEVLGVDIAASVLDAVRPSMPECVTLEAADLRALPFGDGSFDAVVCFEVIEHFDEPLIVLDELVRVLASDGVLLISSPNRGVYTPGNPHHLHEFTPDELRAELERRLSHVRLVRQSDYVVSALLEDGNYRRGDGEQLVDVGLVKLVAAEPGREVYTIALAGRGELPAVPELAAMTGTLEQREWWQVFETQTNAIRDKDNHIGLLEARLAERDAIADRLIESEQRNAEIPALQVRISDLQFELAGARRAEESARKEIRHLEERLERAQRVLNEVFTSPSWQATKPLRAAKKLLRG
jgi:SAM-dependent methyltransferase